MIILKLKQQQSGFALLMALIVVGVVVSVGLVILDLTIKQLNLSTNSKDSEIAFHAANAGLECANYWRNASSTEYEGTGSSVTIDCFGVSASPSTLVHDDTTFGSDKPTDLYEYSLSWGNRCSVIKMFYMTSNDFDSVNGKITLSNSDIRSLIPGYPVSTSDKVCEPGGRCSIISVKGYNKPCANINSVGVLEREVLLES